MFNRPNSIMKCVKQCSDSVLLALAIAMVFAALTTQAQAEDAAIKVTSVSFLQNGSVVDTRNGEQLSGVIDLDVQVNFITNQADFATARLDAWLSVSTPTIASTSFTLLKPSALLTIPTSVDSSTDNSYTATIPSDLLASDLTWVLSWVDHSTNSNPSASHLIKAPVFTPTIFSTPPKKEDVLTLSSAGAVTVGNLMDGSPGTGDAVLSDSCPAGEVVTSMAVRFDGGTIKPFHFTCAPFRWDGTAGPQDGTTVYVTSPFANLPFDAQYQTVSCPSGLLTGLRGMTDTTNVYTMGHFCSRSSQILDGSADLSMGIPIGDPSVVGLGTPSEINCPAGHVMTGVDTYTNANDEITGVYMQCTEVLVNDEIFIGDTSIEGTITQTMDCPSGRVVSNIDALISSINGGKLDGLRFSCAQLNPDGTISDPLSQSELGLMYPPYYGYDPEGLETSLECANGFYTGLSGAHSGFLSKIGGYCKEVFSDSGFISSSLEAVPTHITDEVSSSLCLPDEAMTGVEVTVTDNEFQFLIGVKPQCESIQSVAAENPIYIGDPSIEGTITQTMDCPSGRVISNIDALTSSAFSLYGLRFSCALMSEDGSISDPRPQGELGLTYPPYYGYDGIDETSLDCGNGFYTGLSGGHEHYLEKIGGYCKEALGNGEFSGAYLDPTPSHRPGEPYDSKCPSGEALSGVEVSLDSDSFVIGVMARCESIQLIAAEGDSLDVNSNSCTTSSALYNEELCALATINAKVAQRLCPTGIDDCDYNRLYHQFVDVDSIGAEETGSIFHQAFGLSGVKFLEASCFVNSGHESCFNDGVPNQTTLFDNIETFSERFDSPSYRYRYAQYSYEFHHTDLAIPQNHFIPLLLKPLDILSNTIPGDITVGLEMKKEECRALLYYDNPFAQADENCKYRLIEKENGPWYVKHDTNDAVEQKEINLSVMGEIYHLHHGGLAKPYISNACWWDYDYNEIHALISSDNDANIPAPGLVCNTPSEIFDLLSYTTGRGLAVSIETRNAFTSMGLEAFSFIGEFGTALKATTTALRSAKVAARLARIGKVYKAVDNTVSIMVSGLEIYDGFQGLVECRDDDNKAACQTMQLGSIGLSALFLGADALDSGQMVGDLKGNEITLVDSDILSEQEIRPYIDAVRARYEAETGTTLSNQPGSNATLAETSHIAHGLGENGLTPAQQLNLDTNLDALDADGIPARQLLFDLKANSVDRVGELEILLADLPSEVIQVDEFRFELKMKIEQAALNYDDVSELVSFLEESDSAFRALKDLEVDPFTKPCI